MQLTSLWWSISPLRVSASFKWSLFGVENFGSSSDWDDCAFSRRSIFSFNLFSSIISSIPFFNSLEPLPLVCIGVHIANPPQQFLASYVHLVQENVVSKVEVEWLVGGIPCDHLDTAKELD